MKKILSFSILLTLVFSGINLSAQGGKMSEGQINFKVDLNGAEVEPMVKSMFEDSEMIIRFRKEFVKTDFNMSFGNTTAIMNTKQKKGILLMNMMGQKMAVKMTPEDMEIAESEKPEVEIEYTDDVKTIAGYKCKKAIVKVADAEDVSIYYTEEINPVKFSSDLNFGDLKGFPLQFEMNQGGISMTMKATSVEKKKFDATEFKIEAPEGYTSMSFKELMDMQNAMGQ